MTKAFEDSADTVLQCCVAYNYYGGYCLPLSSRHRPAAQTILRGDIWEPDTIQFLTSHCRDGDIVHAGSYFGDFLPALSHACAQDAKVWTFEPNLENYRCARITAAINNLQNVQLLNAGLGERRDCLPLLTRDAAGRSRGGASRVMERNPNENQDSLMVAAVVTLDEVVPISRTVSIIQLDVEGFEKPALIGASGTIRRCKPILVLETVPQNDWLLSNIQSLGYQMAGTVHSNTIFRCV